MAAVHSVHHLNHLHFIVQTARLKARFQVMSNARSVSTTALVPFILLIIVICFAKIKKRESNPPSMNLHDDEKFHTSTALEDPLEWNASKPRRIYFFQAEASASPNSHQYSTLVDQATKQTDTPQKRQSKLCITWQDPISSSAVQNNRMIRVAVILKR